MRDPAARSTDGAKQHPPKGHPKANSDGGAEVDQRVHFAADNGGDEDRRPHLIGREGTGDYDAGIALAQRPLADGGDPDGTPFDVCVACPEAGDSGTFKASNIAFDGAHSGVVGLHTMR